MILAAAVGVGIEQFTAVERALLPALLIGVFVALLVPAKSACGVNVPQASDGNPPPG